jgi:hypothetical protein
MDSAILLLPDAIDQSRPGYSAVQEKPIATSNSMKNSTKTHLHNKNSTFNASTTIDQHIKTQL